MKKFIFLIISLLVINSANAAQMQITPLKKITTSTKYFQEGNIYKFRDVNTNEIITGTVIFYRPNGIMGQEAQIEISNFRDENNKPIPGKITIIPANHKDFQEFMNYFSISCFGMVRGSEIILKPRKHTFIINNITEQCKTYSIPIKPAQPISTTDDQVEFGDTIKFETTADVNNIKAGTPIYGIVDYIDDNGWFGDNAVIYFKKFITKDCYGNKIVINSNLAIDGFDLLKFKSRRVKQFFSYAGVIFRGKEVDIKPYDKKVRFNLIVK